MKYIGALVLTLLILPSFAQKKESYLQAGISANGYRGELGTYDRWSAGFQAGVLFNHKKRLNGALNFGLGSITGEDGSFGFQSNTNSPAPNNFVKTNFVFLNYDLHINLLKREHLIVHIGPGIGFMRFTPKDEFGDGLETQDRTRQEEETYRNLALMLPVSLGVVYFMPNKMGISVKSSLLNVNTDYLDNISELGDSSNDNMMNVRLSLLVPLGG